MSRSTLLKRSRIIFVNGVSRVLSSMGTAIVALIVVRTQSAELWGSVVQPILLIDFAFSIISWGSNPYLIREFSLEPRNISHFWMQSFLSRLPLLCALLVVIPFLQFSTTLGIYLMIWAIARYVYQSYEPLLVYSRNFLFALLLEVTSMALVVLPIFFIRSPLTTEWIVGLLSLGVVWKCIWATGMIFKIWKMIRWVVNTDFTAYYTAAFPFLLLTFSGMLQQRMDLYLVAWFLGDQSTGVYQVFINWLIFCQFLASLLLSPYAKNIFRLSPTALQKLHVRFSIAGILLSAVSLLGVFIMMKTLYHFDLPVVQYVMGYFYIQMSYAYLLRNYELGKQRKQVRVAIYSFAASGLNLMMSLFLTPQFGMTGALLAATGSQIFLVFLYQKKNPRHAQG